MKSKRFQTNIRSLDIIYNLLPLFGRKSHAVALGFLSLSLLSHPQILNGVYLRQYRRSANPFAVETYVSIEVVMLIYTKEATVTYFAFHISSFAFAADFS